MTSSATPVRRGRSSPTGYALLVDNGVLARHPYGNHPDRFEYRLTEKGLDLYPVIVSLLTWGDRWMADDDGPPVEFRHKDCGHAMHPELACPECGEWVGARDISAESRGADHG